MNNNDERNADKLRRLEISTRLGVTELNDLEKLANKYGYISSSAFVRALLLKISASPFRYIILNILRFIK